MIMTEQTSVHGISSPKKAALRERRAALSSAMAAILRRYVTGRTTTAQKAAKPTNLFFVLDDVRVRNVLLDRFQGFLQG